MAVLLLLPCVASATYNEAVGTVNNVVDGDTIDVQLSDQVVRARLADIDTPEMSTDNGPIAKQYTTQWLYGKTVALDLDNKTGEDAYGRWVAICYLDGKNFNKQLVDAGQACIWDFGNNEFNPADWWNGSIPAEVCVKGDGSGASQPYVGPTTAWAGPGQGAKAGMEDKNFFTSSGQTSPVVSTAYNGPFVASSKSDKYHYPSCASAKRIKSSNLITFATAAEAMAAGYSPCSKCSPP